MTDKYATLASTIKIEDITSKKQNQYILQLRKLNMDYDYIPDDGEDLGWLGYYIGQNTKLQDLKFYTAIDNESFYKEMSCNKSIQEIQFCHISLDGRSLQMLTPSFLKNNHCLTRITVDECNIIEGCIPQLSVAIEGCNKSLKAFELGDNAIREDGSVVNIITALSMHPQLEELRLCGCNIGRNEYTALSTLLRCSITQLKALSLHNNNIDDEGVEYLVNILSNGNMLEILDLSRNEAITIKGWKKV
jgi:Ran GTPase-activating protein (RanGAP) involved in mRNA processing and transport